MSKDKIEELQFDSDTLRVLWKIAEQNGFASITEAFVELDKQKRTIALLQKVLQKWKKITPQIGNGHCAICGSPRLFNIRGRPSPCKNAHCFSTEVDRALKL